MKHYNTIEKSQIMFGDNMKLMDKLPAYSFSLIITDPPYLFSKHCGKEESVKDGRKKSIIRLFMTMGTIRGCAE